MLRSLRPVVAASLFLAACGTGAGDAPAPYEPDPLGRGLRIRDVQDPARKLAGSQVSVTSAIVTVVDNFDETKDGRSRGTIYMQDADKAGPYGGISSFAPSFVPANLRLFPGDVVDVSGQYVETKTIGTTVDFKEKFLPQFSMPTIKARTESKLPDPVLIDIADLLTFDTGRKWIGTLVTVKDLRVQGTPTANGGRVTAAITNDARNGPAISNELFDLKPGAWPEGTQFKSVTGVVTFFFNLKIAPRSEADLVQ
jgi:hypothetical protein